MMKIQITLYCPNCQSSKIKKNGNKANGKQNYCCKLCNRQFIGDHALQYKGWHSGLIQKILLMLVWGLDIRHVAEIEKLSIRKVVSVLVNSNRIISPKQTHYSQLEVDEFWTYVGKNPILKAFDFAFYLYQLEICIIEEHTLLKHLRWSIIETSNRNISYLAASKYRFCLL